MSIDSRLEHLQRQNRGLTAAVVVLAGVVVGMLLAPRSSSTPAPLPSPLAVLTASSTAPTVLVPSSAQISQMTPHELLASSSPPVGKPVPSSAANAHLQIELNPPAQGVTLWMDGRVRAHSSIYGFSLTVRPGRHQLTVGGPQFATYHKTVRLEPGADSVVTMPAWRMASLEIESRPPHARIVVHGPMSPVITGTAPLHLARLRPGRYRVEVSHRGCEGLVMVFHLPPGSQLDKLAVLPEVPPVAWTPPPRHHSRSPLAPPTPMLPGPRATEVDDETPCSDNPDTPVQPTPPDGRPGVQATPQ